jgi:hypothetical protein
MNLCYSADMGLMNAVQMIQIMQRMSEGENGSEVAKTRVAVLSKYL